MIEWIAPRRDAFARIPFTIGHIIPHGPASDDDPFGIWRDRKEDALDHEDRVRAERDRRCSTKAGDLQSTMWVQRAFPAVME